MNEYTASTFGICLAIVACVAALIYGCAYNADMDLAHETSRVKIAACKNIEVPSAEAACIQGVKP